MRPVRIGVRSFVILIGGACSSSGSNPSSTTPRITSAKVGAVSKAKLLTARDVQRVAAFTGARAQELTSVPLFENPDLRGPCGGHVSGLSFKGGYGRAFATAQRQLVQIDMPSTAALRGLLSALQTDVHQPCLPYNSQTNTGSTQHVSDIHVVDLSKLGVPALAWTETITAEGHSIPGGVAEMEANGTFVFLQFTGLRPLDDASIEALSQAALKRATA